MELKISESTVGGSLGTFKLELSELVELLGKPHIATARRAYWTFETDNGLVFSVYNFATETSPLEHFRYWFIAGQLEDPEILKFVWKFQDFLKTRINKPIRLGNAHDSEIYWQNVKIP